MIQYNQYKEINNLETSANNNKIIFAFLPSQDEISVFTFWLSSTASLYRNVTDTDGSILSV